MFQHFVTFSTRSDEVLKSVLLFWAQGKAAMFAHCVFNDAASNPGYITSISESVNNELGKKLMAHSDIFLKGLRKSMKLLQSSGRPGQDSNWALLEDKSEVSSCGVM